jgi:hypothetical protein
MTSTRREISLFTALAGLAGLVLLTGCSSTGSGGVHGRGRTRDRDQAYDRRDRQDRRERQEDDEPRPHEVRGTVESVDPVNHRIDLSQGERGGRLAIYYDYRTGPGREPLRVRPKELRPGDRIRADVLPTPGGLLVQQLEVLSRGDRPYRDAPDAGGSRRDLGSPESRPDLRETPEVRESPEIRDETRAAGPLRGIVRYVDTSARTLEIETSSGQGRPPRVTVQYDDATSVESQGKRFSPDNLQLGNRVEIDLRVDGGGRLLLAQRIALVGRDQPENH